jgi:hypothetical protein
MAEKRISRDPRSTEMEDIPASYIQDILHRIP